MPQIWCSRFQNTHQYKVPHHSPYTLLVLSSLPSVQNRHGSTIWRTELAKWLLKFTTNIAACSPKPLVSNWVDLGNAYFQPLQSNSSRGQVWIACESL
jgi:hypothetical protein